MNTNTEIQPVPDLRTVAEEAAKALESAAAHNRAEGRTVFAHSQQDRADRLRAALAASTNPTEKA